jgi:DhnA family fructose-bisphosphate aldolase class Ia
VGDREILQRTHELLAQGASGIVYGRNIIQHAKPAAITKALMGLVHDGLSVDAAAALLNQA